MSRLLLALLILVALAALATPANAQTGSSLLLQPFRTSDQVETGTGATFLFTTLTDNRDLDGNEFDFSAETYEGFGRIRLTQGTSQRGLARAQPRAGFATRYTQLHSSDPALPDELFDGSVAVGMGVLSHQGWVGGFALGAGYAGVDFEGDANAPYLQASFALGKTYENGDALGLVLEYNGNRTFLPDWPLPGFQYRTRLDRPRPKPPDADPPQTRPGPRFEGYDPSAEPPRFMLAIGIPFTQLQWRPVDRLRVELVYMIPESLNARVDWTVIGDPEISGLALYASLSQTVGAFHSNELDGNDRLFFRQTFAEAGVSWRLHDRLDLVLAGGMAFDQEFEAGWDTRDTDPIAEIDETPYVRALARLRL